MPQISFTDFVKCRKNAVAEDSMGATEAAEVTKASGREERGLGSASRAARRLFTSSFQNMATMKGRGRRKLKLDRHHSEVQTSDK